MRSRVRVPSAPPKWLKIIVAKHTPERMIKWVLSAHAVLRMEERNLSIEEVKRVVEHPDYKLPQGDKWIFAKKIGARRDNDIAAVVLEKKERALWVVITLMVRFEKRK